MQQTGLQRSAATAERRFLSYKNWVSSFILDSAIVCECRIVFRDKHEMELTILYLIGLLSMIFNAVAFRNDMQFILNSICSRSDALLAASAFCAPTPISTSL